jgi:hypothetical protein
MNAGTGAGKDYPNLGRRWHLALGVGQIQLTIITGLDLLNRA